MHLSQLVVLGEKEIERPRSYSDNYTTIYPNNKSEAAYICFARVTTI